MNVITYLFNMTVSFQIINLIEILILICAENSKFVIVVYPSKLLGKPVFQLLISMSCTRYKNYRFEYHLKQLLPNI